ncbi:hypothetical protein GCM10023156_55300 [Novipirellula rosea]|uniref:Uncharacterized protein n=1 Tax=Novipirellula rosea TaxID=1031540 RepID=A0ABP8NJI5_9BACT
MGEIKRNWSWGTAQAEQLEWDGVIWENASPPPWLNATFACTASIIGCETTVKFDFPKRLA